jgi:hypothetical protein
MFKNNKKEGFGIKTWANGSRYEGYWHNDKMHGEGTFKWDKGDVYQGGYKNGMRDGKGTKTWASGTEYTVWLVSSRVTGRETRETVREL